MSSRRSRSGGMWTFDDRQPVVEVLAKAPLVDLRRQHPIGGRHHPDIDGPRPLGANPSHFSPLQHPQQLGLKLERQLTNLIEENRSAIGPLKRAPVVAESRR
jgi:hypothetical protein